MANLERVAGVMVDANKANEIRKGSYKICGCSCDWSLVEAGEAVLSGKMTPYGFTKRRDFCEQARAIYSNYHNMLVRYNYNQGLDEEGNHTHNILAGIACNDDIYGRFIDNRYNVPGRALTYSIAEIERSADCPWYSDEERATFKGVLSTIKEELQKTIDEESGVYKTMKHTNFTDYLQDSKEVYQGARVEYAGLIDSISQAQQELERLEANRTQYSDKDYFIKRVTC